MARKRYAILIADDHPAMRESIASAVEDDHSDKIEVVAQAADGAAAVEEALKRRPDLVVLDIGLPRLDGIQALRKIKAALPETVVLIFSMYDDRAHVIEAIRAGADDYLFKQESRPSEVAEHILRALEKKLALQDKLHERLFTVLRGVDAQHLDLGLTPLTGAELEVLRLAAHKGWSMKEIARELSGKDRSVSELTVRKHFEHIYEKLGAQGQAHAGCLAIKHGLISADPAEPTRS
jgi:DNA-binding NarL/FixJ family response regulator